VWLHLQPTNTLFARDKLEVPPKMEAVMRGMYNDSQMDAVTAGLGGSPLVLVQGPPGQLLTCPGSAALCRL
jgi:hypothetical protein